MIKYLPSMLSVDGNKLDIAKLLELCILPDAGGMLVPELLLVVLQ